MFVEAALRGDELPVALNFGPDPDGLKTVGEVVALAEKLEPTLVVETLNSAGPKETAFLTLNSDQAHSLLGWRNTITFMASVQMSLVASSDDARVHSTHNISSYLDL
jgi:hypothetical protein